MSKQGSLYQQPVTVPEDDNDIGDSEDFLWDTTAVEVVKDEPTPKPQYLQDLEQPVTGTDATNDTDYKFSESVQSWTDFMYSRYHPRSINLVSGVEHSADEDALDCFTSGVEIWKNENFEDELGDKIRQYIEECNNCQVHNIDIFT